MRWGLSIVLGIAVLSTGCDFEKLVKDIAKSAKRKETPTASISRKSSAALTGKTERTISIGSFNIQVFGQSKLTKPEAMQVLADVVRRFDVLAIQEIRSKNQDVIPRFLELINSDGSQYEYVIGPRLGRTSSKEQYAYLYDAKRIEVVPGSVYTVADPNDQLHREPLVGTFRVHSTSPNAFQFTLINIHTDPDEVDWELDALDDVFLAVQRDRIQEDDVILLGDLNADEYHLGQLGRLPGITYAIAGLRTNTRGTESYDNLLFDRRRTVEFSGQAGVIDLQREYGLTEAEALEVSDHLPIWASFSTTENAPVGPVASGPVSRN